MNSVRLKALTGLSAMSLLILACAVAGATFLAWMRLATMNDLPVQTGHFRIAQMQRAADVKFSVTEAASSLRLAMLVQTPEDLARATADIAAMRVRVNRTMAAWRLDIVTPSGQERFGQIEQLIGRFWESMDADVQRIEAGQKDEALASLMLDTTPLLGKLYGALEFEQDRQGDLLSASVASVEEMVWTVRGQMLVWAGAGVAGLLGLFWYLVRALRRRQPGRAGT